MSSLDDKTLLKDEYTQKAIDLYAKLQINSEQALTLDQISQDYAQSQKALSNANILCSNYYLCR